MLRKLAAFCFGPGSLSDVQTDVPGVFPGSDTAPVGVQLGARLLSQKCACCDSPGLCD